MARRRRYAEEEPEESMQLGDVLEPYEEEAWDDAQQDYQFPQEPYDDEAYAGEYSDEHEAADHESHFRIAIDAFDLTSIIIGILVILVLVAMLLTLVDWLRSDVLHTMLLMQSGLQ